MDATYNNKTKRLAAALAVAPALMFTGAGTAHAGPDTCRRDLVGRYRRLFGTSRVGGTRMARQARRAGHHWKRRRAATGCADGNVAHPIADIPEVEPDAPMNDPFANLPDLAPGTQRTFSNGQWGPAQPAPSMGPNTGPVPPKQNQNPNPYCSWVFWPNNLPIEGSGGACPP